MQIIEWVVRQLFYGLKVYIKLPRQYVPKDKTLGCPQSGYLQSLCPRSGYPQSGYLLSGSPGLGNPGLNTHSLETVLAENYPLRLGLVDAMRRKVGIPRAILPHLQTGLTIGNPYSPVTCLIQDTSGNLYHG